MFDDAETLTIEYLTGTLDPLVTVSTHVPIPRPNPLVRIMQTGARRTDVAHQLAQITVECWHTDEAEASLLARTVQAVLCDWWRVPQGSGGWLSGPYSSPDPTSGTPRYAMTCLISQKVS